MTACILTILSLAVNICRSHYDQRYRHGHRHRYGHSRSFVNKNRRCCTHRSCRLRWCRWFRGSCPPLDERCSWDAPRSLPTVPDSNGRIDGSTWRDGVINWYPSLLIVYVRLCLFNAMETQWMPSSGKRKWAWDERRSAGIWRRFGWTTYIDDIINTLIL